MASDDYSAKEKALALAPKFSAILSMFGSSFIMYDVFKTGQVFTSTHHRLLMGMSACSFLVSLLAFFMSTWPIPAHEDIYGAVGNQASCDAQGFFSQFSLAVVMYNASLSAYYLAKIRYQISTKTLHGKLEPLLHIVPLTVALGTAIAGVALGLYNSESWECWISTYPDDCEESWSHGGKSNCIRGDNASLYRWGFYYGFLWLAIIFVSVNMFRVYRGVFQQEEKMNKYNFEYQRELEKLEKQRLHDELQQLYDQDSDNSSVGSAASVASARSVISVASSIAGSALRSASFVARISYQSIKSIPKMQRKRDALKRHFKHSRQVARQGYWFLGAFLATWVFPTIARIIHLVTKQTFYPLILLTAIFVPIQGFFNFLVYIQSHKKQREQLQKSVCCGWKLLSIKRKRRPSTSSSTSNPEAAEGREEPPINAKDVSSSSSSSDIDIHQENSGSFLHQEHSGSFLATSELMRLSDAAGSSTDQMRLVVATIDPNLLPDAEDMDATSVHANNNSSRASQEFELTSEHLRALESFDAAVNNDGNESQSDLTISNASIDSSGDVDANDNERTTESDDGNAKGKAAPLPSSNSGNNLSTKDHTDSAVVNTALPRIPTELELAALRDHSGVSSGFGDGIHLNIPNSGTCPMVDQSELTHGDASSIGHRRRLEESHHMSIPSVQFQVEEEGESDLSDSSVSEQRESKGSKSRKNRRRKEKSGTTESKLESKLGSMLKKMKTI